MTDHQDPPVNAAHSPADLSYAIRSARAVVEALIARDRSAAEEAALRTCRDCDLLIRLIRDLVLLLRDPFNQQFGFDPVETAALVRRTEHVLSLVDASPPGSQSSVKADREVHDESRPVLQKHGVSSRRPTQDATPTSSPNVRQGPTVASLGLRVQLVPLEANDHTTTPGEERTSTASQRAAGDAPLGTDER
jgi:hypothetical protein